MKELALLFLLVSTVSEAKVQEAASLSGKWTVRQCEPWMWIEE